MERFWKRVDKDGPLSLDRPDLGPCWVWTGNIRTGWGKEPGGYGRFSVSPERSMLAHRMAYELSIGPIPEGKVLDHLCHGPSCPGGACLHRRCVNPDHLEAVTQRTNVMRQPNTGTETHCPHGHAFSVENTYITPKGGRQCRQCKTEAMRRFNARNPGRNHHATD